MTQEKIAARSGAGSRLPRWLRAREMRILAIVVAVAAILTLTTPYFMNPSNLTAVTIGFATDAIIAIAMTIVLITGGFDLSVGSVLALSGVVVGLLLHNGWNMWPAMAVALAVGALVGAINGMIITRIKVNPLITTLGMMGIASSASLVISGGYPVSSFPKQFLYLGQGMIGPIPVPVLIMGVMVLVGDILLRRTRWLRLTYYVGTNDQAADLSGLPVARVRLLAYIFCSVMAAFAGIIATARLSAAFPLAGAGTELRVISACVIGGASLAGGEGSVIGALLGVLLMALISNGLVLLNVSIYWQGIVTGVILIAAVTLDTLSRRGRS